MWCFSHQAGLQQKAPQVQSDDTTVGALTPFARAPSSDLLDPYLQQILKTLSYVSDSEPLHPAPDQIPYNLDMQTVFNQIDWINLLYQVKGLFFFYLC